jgi:glucuronate isomerase
MKFIHEDFLLQTRAARRLYHQFAEPEPILDYHCHLSPRDIAENRQFNDLFEIWLEGDHYKWRAMRSNGVAERYCTGEAKPFEKFQAWAATVPHTVRNPLYHWTHLELKRYFVTRVRSGRQSVCYTGSALLPFPLYLQTLCASYAVGTFHVSLALETRPKAYGTTRFCQLGT